MSLAPVAVFAFNRPNHLKGLFNSLLENPEATKSKFFVFVDGPRNSDDEKNIDLVESTILNYKEFLDIQVRKSVENNGLAHSLMSGIDEVLDKFNELIVLEDDLLVSPNFLKFCNLGLSVYRDNLEVASIQGFTPVIVNQGKGTYFLQGADCWGWATWRNRWSQLERDSEVLLRDLESLDLVRSFDLDGSFPYTEMLRRQARGEIDSWAIRWHASMFTQGKVSLYPCRSLVLNTGFDGTGTHLGGSENLGLARELPPPDYFPDVDKDLVQEDPKARKLIIRYSRERYGSYPLWHVKKIVRTLVRILKSIFPKLMR